MKCPDFDKEFQKYLTAYLEQHAKDYKNYDAMEEDMPAIYMRWVNQPQDFLEGFTPGSFFMQYDDGKQLVDWMCEYDKLKISIPEQLQERISEMPYATEKRLVKLLEDESISENLQCTAIGMLQEMQSDMPKMLYIKRQLKRRERDEAADMMIESLRTMGKGVVTSILQEIDGAGDAGKLALLDVLCEYPGSKKAVELCKGFFKERTAQRALFAGYLAKLGDDSALPMLYETARAAATNYLDYIEIRNAIEALGGDPPEERDFSEDPYYISMKSME
ncbi:MAG: hypothetical protein PHI27_09700 [Eubacteriales bacterium]|nr:hypothetical protein [Eubacteriales bacterium]MDD3882516.1 hypothetical protein [Eubacteriales bacterium]MDD4512816.1 hypothetical protein [Eubacteriales bacterium]